MSTPHPAVQ